MPSPPAQHVCTHRHTHLLQSPRGDERVHAGTLMLAQTPPSVTTEGRFNHSISSFFVVYCYCLGMIHYTSNKLCSSPHTPPPQCQHWSCALVGNDQAKNVMLARMLKSLMVDGWKPTSSINQPSLLLCCSAGHPCSEKSLSGSNSVFYNGHAEEQLRKFVATTVISYHFLSEKALQLNPKLVSKWQFVPFSVHRVTACQLVI